METCCIDKQSSAELLEAINLMYCWYKNAKVCYVYLHDVDGFFPTQQDATRYPRSNGWPEWFLCGWTLQEMIALSDVQFFNKNWQHIGDKRTLAWTLTDITGVPMHILRDGVYANWLCIAWIISWAANWMMMQVEDRAYSLMDMLNVNMPMLYGEGRKVFHCLQLEIIWSTNDQSIFVWGWNSCRVYIGSTLANDLSFFEDCGSIMLIGHHKFIWWCKIDSQNCAWWTQTMVYSSDKLRHPNPDAPLSPSWIQVHLPSLPTMPQSRFVSDHQFGLVEFQLLLISECARIWLWGLPRISLSVSLISTHTKLFSHIRSRWQWSYQKRVHLL